ncbi:MAG: DUF3789 domain-containing protein [Clostridiales bacterium]|nr:DUF3789 domain-containing protein [Clostridiales bacterium]
MISHFIAFCLGGFMGVSVMSLCFVAHEADKRDGTDCIERGESK